MKKILTIMCATALLGFAACNKDKNEPGNGGNSGQAETVQGEGIYNPAVKINRISYSDTTPDQIWVWDGNRLASIMTDTEDGGIDFEYTSEDRLQTVEASVMGADIEATLSYNAQKLISGAGVNVGGIDALSAVMTHNAQNKLSHISLDADDELINMLLTLLPSLMGDMMGDSTGDSPLNYLTAAPASKLSLENKSFEADFVWNGNNVARMIVNASLTMSTTLNEIPTELLQTMVPEEYRGMIDLAVSLMGDTPIPVQLTVADTVDYTYDNKKNPLKGFFGQVSIAALSTNNIVTVSGHGNANISATIDLGITTMPLGQDTPLNDLGSNSYNYTYTANGYPSVVTDADGNTTTYTYKE